MKLLKWVLSKRVLRFFLMLAGLWLVFAIGLTIAVHTYGQNDQAQHADVIIVLGSGLRRDGSAGDALTRRSHRAAEVWKSGYAPSILCTGGISEGQQRSEASACKEILIADGVPENMIILEEQSRSTEENAMYARAIMDTNGWNNAILVTDSFHAFRAHWIFNDQNITNYPSPVPIDRVRKSWYVRFVTREIFALHWQAVKEIFNLPYTYVNMG